MQIYKLNHKMGAMTSMHNFVKLKIPQYILHIIHHSYILVHCLFKVGHVIEKKNCLLCRNYHFKAVNGLFQAVR